MSFALTSGASSGSPKPIDELRHRLFRRLRGRHQPEPHVGFEILVAGFRHRRQIRQRLDPLQRHGGERAGLAGGHLLANLRPVQHGGGHVRAEQRIHGRRAARIRHVGQIGPGQPLEPFDADVLGGVGPDAGDRQLARLGARRVQKLRKRAIGRRAVDDDDLRRRDQIADRLEAGLRIVIHLSQDRADDDAVVVAQQRVAVRRRARHRFGRDDAAGAGPAFDDDRLASGCFAIWSARRRNRISMLPPGGTVMTTRIVRAACDHAGPIRRRDGQAHQRHGAGRQGEKLPHSASLASLEMSAGGDRLRRTMATEIACPE